jgi:catechol 2,3-dioxygenase-like lactoylglutathione lyase family enzyme
MLSLATMGVTAVHSVNRFVFTIPDLDDAERFYEAFGLDVRKVGRRLDLYTYGHPHCWGSVHANGEPKKLAYVSYGIFAGDLESFRRRIKKLGLECRSHPLSDGAGLWLFDPDGSATQVIVAPKVSPCEKSKAAISQGGAPRLRAAPSRSKVAPVRPRHLSHVLRFTPDVPRMVQFCTEVLGLRLSDQSQDVIAFLRGAHGSDHHLVAFAKSEAPGLHHMSWDVGSLDDLGCGAEQMRAQGYAKGWGVGRHVLGSNYFYYVQDPWGSFAEYSFDIDFIPADLGWQAGDHPAEDSLYVWGPLPPDDFITNYEAHLGGFRPAPENVVCP